MLTAGGNALLAWFSFLILYKNVDGGNGRLVFGNEVFKNTNFTEHASKSGYKSEEHTVVTKDGYILIMFRIPKGKNCRGKVKKPPVLLMHGLIMNSDTWLDAGPSAGLAYLLADACYDLWAGNVRGNYYGRRHIRLNPDTDAEFWKFSTHEMGVLDLPATMDYVLNYTKSTHLMYVGYSQGCRIFLTMCSDTTGYCDKAKVSVFLAPSVRVKYTRSLPVNLLMRTYAVIAPLLHSATTLQVFQKDSPVDVLLSTVCGVTFFARSVCKLLLSLIDSFDPGSILTETAKVLYDNFPEGTSAYTLAIYGQTLISGRFQKYDYGRSKNLEIYGEAQPPLYNLTRTSVPVVFIYGNNDFLVDPKDVIWLSEQLPKVLETYKVARSTWNHLDDCYSQYTNLMIFPKINQYLQKYSFT